MHAGARTIIWIENDAMEWFSFAMMKHVLDAICFRNHSIAR